jgi:hypothetical protein
MSVGTSKNPCGFLSTRSRGDFRSAGRPSPSAAGTTSIILWRSGSRQRRGVPANRRASAVLGGRVRCTSRGGSRRCAASRGQRVNGRAQGGLNGGAALREYLACRAILGHHLTGGPARCVPFCLTADFDVVQNAERIGHQNRRGVVGADQIGDDCLVVDAHEADVQPGLDFVGNSGLV